jgi:hypothetical protein
MRGVIEHVFIFIWITYKSQGFLLVKLKSLLRKLNRRHHDLVDRY